MLQIGMLLAGRYEILQQIGSGGMAYVYRAKDSKLNRYVAIKVLKETYCKDKTFVAKFKMEAQSAAGLSHANIVGVYDVGEADDNVHYIVMELIEGITLKEYITRKKRLGIRETIGISIQVAQGLEAAHSCHLIHRDIKPQNIIISRDGKTKVTDFGIARAITDETTNMYKAAGSVHYISPEQARGGYCDERSDIYSLGITMYEMVTGRVPFDGETTVAVAIAHMNEAMIPPHHFCKEIPPALEQIILKCVQKKPDNRYASCIELIADLRQAIVMPQASFVRFHPGSEGFLSINGEENTRPGGNLDNQDTIRITPVTPKFSAEQPFSQNYRPEGGEEKTEDAQEYEEGASLDDQKRKSKKSSGTEKKRTSDAEERRLPSFLKPATAFDYAILWIAALLGFAILGMAIYIGISFNSFLFPKSAASVHTTVVTTAASTAVVTTAALTEKETTAAATTGIADVTKVETTEAELTFGTDETRVPNVLGYSVEEATALLTDAGLEIYVSKSYEYSDEYAAGDVCRQQYEADTILAKGTRVKVYISIGSDKFYADSSLYVGNDINVITSALGSFPEVQVETVGITDENTEKDVVLSLDPSDSYIAPGETLTIYYSNGPSYVAVPNLIGLTQAAAQLALEKKGLLLGSVGTEYSSTVDANLVSGQSYAIDTVVPVGTYVNITVSLGAKTIAVPNVTGMTDTEAIKTILYSGLAYIPEYQANSAAAGTVIGQNPAYGNWIAEGGIVTIYVSTGPQQTQINLWEVAGMTQAEAINYLTSRGLTYTFSSEPNEWIAAGLVIRLIPPSSAVYEGDQVLVNAGDQITIILSTGPDAAAAP